MAQAEKIPDHVETSKGFVRRDVEQVLARILKSEQFSSAQQLGDFLSYIVKQTLDGDAENIKAYSIAVDALGKDENFDPQTNAAVRVAAGRLRQALALYNAEADNAGAPVVITLEPGSYVPTFTSGKSTAPARPAPGHEGSGADYEAAVKQALGHRDPPLMLDRETRDSVTQLAAHFENRKLGYPRTRKGWIGAVLLALLAVIAGSVLWGLKDQQALQNLASRLGVMRSPAVTLPVEPLLDLELRPRIKLSIILPDLNYPAWFKPGELEDATVLAITRFDDYSFVGAKTQSTVSLTEDREADYHLLITGYNRSGTLQLYGRLIRENDGAVLWSHERNFAEQADPGPRDVEALVGTTFSPVGSPYGVIYADLLGESDKREQLKCVVLGFQYFRRESRELRDMARRCLEDLIRRGTKLPSVHAQMAFIYADLYRQGAEVSVEDGKDLLAAAEKSALAAIAFGPTSARAHQALLTVRKVRGDFEGARSAGQKAVALNPYDTDILGDFGAWLISVGEFDAGNKLMQSSEKMLETHPAWFDVYRFLGEDLGGNPVQADALAASFDISRSPLIAMVVAISASRAGKLTRTRDALSEIKKKDPLLFSDTLASLKKRGFAPQVAQAVVDRLNNAKAITGN